MPRIVRFHETGTPDVLRIEQHPAREPGRGEVRIAVRAIGLNRAEAMFRQGTYLEAPVLPSGLGYEASGVVDAIGAEVEGIAVGDRVATVPSFSMNRYGMYGDQVIAPASAVVVHPDGIGFETAAAAWMQYLTAWGALHHIAALRADDVVLIPAASSSVGLAAIQICRAAGARPVALTRSDAKRAALSAAAPGIDVIVTGEQDLVAETMRLTDGKGARIVFDPVGGPTLEKLAQAASQGGIVFQYGALSPDPTPLPLFTLLSKHLTIRGYTLFELSADPSAMVHAKRYVLDGLASGSLQPVIARRFPFEQVADAHRFLESNEQVGKILLTVAE